MKTLPDWIFKCYKCGHLRYVDKTKLVKLLKEDCPECGEEACENWILTGQGNFDKEIIS